MIESVNAAFNREVNGLEFEIVDFAVTEYFKDGVTGFLEKRKAKFLR